MKIGITGLASGGKTVFLSSLIWQLMEFESSDLALDRGLKLEDFREKKPSGGKEGRFPFEEIRESFSRDGDWPKKTRACCRYACEFRRLDWANVMKRAISGKFSDRQSLEFFDFPGERVADAAIAAFSSFSEWSDHLLGYFKSHSDYRAAVAPFMEQLSRTEQTVADFEVLVDAYKLALAQMALDCKPLISPSVFLLDEQGVQAKRDQSAERLARSRLVGVSEERQFVPLPKSVREEFPALHKEMRASYRLYRKRVVLPLFKEIGSAKQLIVLVDVPSILNGGVDHYNDSRQVVLDLFDVLRPDSSIGSKLWKLFTFWRGGLKKVAFVAAKSDLVHPSELESGRLQSLLRQMTSRTQSMLPSVNFQWFCCSAVRSTRKGSEDGTLVGRLAVKENEDKREEMEFPVPALPDHWPKDWEVGDYRFPSVWPEIHKNYQSPPPHHGMGRLIQFLLGGKR